MLCERVVVGDSKILGIAPAICFPFYNVCSLIKQVFNLHQIIYLHIGLQGSQQFFLHFLDTTAELIRRPCPLEFITSERNSTKSLISCRRSQSNSDFWEFCCLTSNKPCLAGHILHDFRYIFVGLLLHLQPPLKQIIIFQKHRI